MVLRSLQIANESLQREKSVLEMDVNSLRNEKKDLLRQLDYNQKLLDSMAQEVVREKNDKTTLFPLVVFFQQQNYFVAITTLTYILEKSRISFFILINYLTNI